MRWFVALACVMALAGCGQTWNNPYPKAGADANILYRGYSAIPNHLDPARSYAVNEVRYIGNIYEPPLQYAYLKRPYTLIPRTLTAMPTRAFYDAQGHRLPADAPDNVVATSVWTLHIKPGIDYQPHPAFAKDKHGQALYGHLTASDIAGVYSPSSFAHASTRELVAADYVYEIKRLADPHVMSPIYSLMAKHIKGFEAFSKKVKRARKAAQKAQGANAFVDLSTIPLAGVKVVDRYTYKIILNGRYPQFRFWLAMPFFAPMPVEVLRFYHQSILQNRNITIDRFPVGTGPYMMIKNRPNYRIVLLRNPNFHGEKYPDQATPSEIDKGLLKDAGKSIPFIKKVVFSLERESIPYWNKFMQGYYDVSGVSSESFGHVINISGSGAASLSPDMRRKHIKLNVTVAPSIYYIGFNMLDDVVGGYTKGARQLRRAISIALNYKQYVGIFLNGRGVAAQGPIPPPIYGHQSGEGNFNHYIFDWHKGRAVRRPVSDAKKLLAAAGYPNGIDPATGEPLVIHLDTTGNGPAAGARFAWLRKQFKKINIRLVIRNTTFTRLQHKMAKGDIQLYSLGWSADYPDPENFLFLLYGPNGKVAHGGVNIANYNNPEFNRLYQKMRDLPNGKSRMSIIKKMVHIVRRDAPWVWGFYPKIYALHHAWLHNREPNVVAHNTLKYLRIDTARRATMRAEFNQPSLWPLLLAVVVVIALLVPAVIIYRRRNRRIGRGEGR